MPFDSFLSLTIYQFDLVQYKELGSGNVAGEGQLALCLPNMSVLGQQAVIQETSPTFHANDREK